MKFRLPECPIGKRPERPLILAIWLRENLKDDTWRFRDYRKRTIKSPQLYAQVCCIEIDNDDDALAFKLRFNAHT